MKSLKSISNRDGALDTIAETQSHSINVIRLELIFIFNADAGAGSKCECYCLAVRMSHLDAVDPSISSLSLFRAINLKRSNIYKLNKLCELSEAAAENCKS